MKLLIAITVALIVCAHNAPCVEAAPVPYEAMNMEQAEAFLKSAEGDKVLEAFVAAAFRSQRMDLLEIGFRNPSTCAKIRDGAAVLPESIYKDRLVLMMLKTASPYWPVDDPLFRRFPAGVVSLMREPFVSVLKKLLPETPLNDALLDNRAARLKLAAEVQAAIDREAAEKDIAPPTKETAISAHQSKLLTAGAPNGTSTKETAPRNPPSIPNDAAAQKKGGLFTVLVALIATLLLAGALMVFVRRKGI